MTFTLISYLVTGISGIVLIGLFTWRLTKFLGKINPIIADLKSYNSTQSYFGFKKSDILKEVQVNYKKSFNNSQTESKAKAHFSLDKINTIDFNLGFYSSYNNTLIGLGIFFTFVGLTLGVGYFGYSLSTTNTANQSEAISEGINVLMGGMGTAFASSVLGMFFSLWFSKTYKEKINAVDAGLSYISNDLDAKFLKTTSDFAAERDQKLVKLIKHTLEESKLTYVDESDNVIGMATMTKGILTESKRQSDSLASFSDDIADAFYDAMNRENEENGSITNILREGFQKLLEADRDPVTDLVDNLLEELNKTFAKMSTDITSSIESVMTDIQSKAGGQVIQQANEAATELNKVTDHISKLPEILKQVNSQTDETASFTKEMLQKVNETIANLQSTIELQNLAAEEIEQATKIYADKRSEMNNSLDTIKNTSRSLEKTVEKLDSDFDKYTSHTISLENKRSKNLENVSALVDDAAQMNTNLILNLQKIETSIEVVFTNISKGLKGYHDQINLNTNVELKAYSEAVVEITRELRSVVNTLNNSIEDLDSRLGRNN